MSRSRNLDVLALATLVATTAFPPLLAAADTPEAAAPSPPAAAPRRTVAVTIDDLPFVAYGLPLEAVAPLSRKLVAGMELGNHTFGHPGLTKTPLPAMQDAVVKGEVVTRGLLQRRGQKLKWFRHPYAQTGTTREIRDAFDAFLSSRGYTVAPLSIEHEDWVFASADAKLAADRDEAGRAR